MFFGAIDAARPNNTKDPDDFIYSGWGIGFDRNGTFGHPEGGTATKDFFVLGRDLLQLIQNTRIYAEKTYSPNFSAENELFVLSLHCNGDNSFLFVNGQNVTQFKAKDSIINNARVLTLGALTVPVYPSDFSVDYSPISNENILKIHKYLMKKNGLI